MLSLFPFFTIAVIVKLVFSEPNTETPLIEGIRAILGVAGGTVLLVVYLAIQIAFIYFILRQFSKKDAESPESTYQPDTGDSSSNSSAIGQNDEYDIHNDPEADEDEFPENNGLSRRNEHQSKDEDDREYKEIVESFFRYDNENTDAEPIALKESVSPLQKARIPEKRAESATDTIKRPFKKKWSTYAIDLDSVLNEYKKDEYWKVDKPTQDRAEALKRTLEEFNILAEVTGIQKGPVITMFEILPAPGVKLSKIVNLADNIALRLAASRVRIVAPIPGKQAVGIEVPNQKRSIVSLREILSHPAFEESKAEIPIALGKDITGVVQFADLTQMPHLLIAGSTGSGKSVCVNSIISSILFRKSPAEARLLLIDPKIVELKFYNDIPHLLTPVITDPKKAFQALQYCIAEMERRYSLLDALCVRDIRSYNKKVKKKSLATEPLPYIVIVIDEFADLMATTGKELESTLARLAAMSRAVGIHLVLATQRPSIDVITGLIKANIPSRIAFMVAGKFDSRIIIDAVGAEKLLGQGDMLFLPSWDPFPVRMQGTYISDEEVENLVNHVKEYGEPDYIDDEIFIDDDDEISAFLNSDSDPMYNKALDVVLAAGKASTSYVQRKLKIGYNRAARLIEEMEMRGIVGPPNGSKPRDVIHVPSQPR
ncbi:MAG: DNA translocase FtsK [Spirochaetales bacterium]|nr:DNA translocase FtsK [Spirochaetales bacterium]